MTSTTIFRILVACGFTRQAAGASATIWYAEEVEVNFVEGLMLLVLVVLALAFETIWHTVSHQAEDSYYFGRMQQESSKMESGHHGGHGHDEVGEMHTQLLKELVNRMAGEFMSLGFLAFLIFSANQCMLFEYLASQVEHCPGSASANETSSRRRGARLLAGSDVEIMLDADCWHMPASSGDWLYLAETVHIKLFLGMMLYFMLMFGIVRGTIHKLEEWEKLRLRRLNAAVIHSATTKKTILKQGIMQGDVELQHYQRVRDYFVTRVCEWQEDRPKLYRMALETAEISSDAEDADTAFRKILEERFVFSAYLAINVEYGVMEMIEVHSYTWVCIATFFVCAVFLHRFSKVTLVSLVPMLVVLAFMVVLIMVYLTRWRSRLIIKYKSGRSGSGIRGTQTDSRSESVDQVARQVSGPLSRFQANLSGRGSVSTEKWVLRFLQVFLFIISYNCAGTIADAHHWRDYWIETLLTAVSFALLFAILLYCLPRYVPDFLQIMSLPPFVDDDNFAVFTAILARAEPVDITRLPSSPVSVGGVHSHGPHNNKEALGAVLELATLLEKCESMADLKEIHQKLELRLRKPAKQEAEADHQLSLLPATPTLKDPATPVLKDGTSYSL